MRRLSSILIAATAVLALLPATALAAGLTPQRMQSLDAAPATAGTNRSFSLPQGLSAAVRSNGSHLAPASATSAAAARMHVSTSPLVVGPCTVTAHVLNMAGAAVPAAWVELWYKDVFGVWQYVGEAQTDAAGLVTFVNVPETTLGELDASLADGNEYYSWGNTFTAAGPNDFTLRPASTGASVFRTSDSAWNWWNWVSIETRGTLGGATTWTQDAVSSPIVSASPFVMAPDYSYAVGYPYDNQGIEWSTSPALGVTTGVADGRTSMNFDQSNGRGAWFWSPYWASGKAGTRTTLILENWPAGYRVAFYGWSQAPSGVLKDWPYYVESNGATYGSTAITIPSSAPAGYDYELHAYRYDDATSWLDLTLYFQVASLNASRTKIAHGGSVRLSGVVPTEGHMGTQAGNPKTMTLYKRTSSAGVPKTWDATKKGWRKVGTVKANGYGKFQTPLLHPTRSTWYVMRYPGDGWYHDAYTAVRKVTVR